MKSQKDIIKSDWEGGESFLEKKANDSRIYHKTSDSQSNDSSWILQVSALIFGVVFWINYSEGDTVNSGFVALYVTALIAFFIFIINSIVRSRKRKKSVAFYTDTTKQKNAIRADESPSDGDDLVARGTSIHTVDKLFSDNMFN